MLKIKIAVIGPKTIKGLPIKIVDTHPDVFIHYIKTNFPNATLRDNRVFLIEENNKILTITIEEDDLYSPNDIVNECWNHILKEEQ